MNDWVWFDQAFSVRLIQTLLHFLWLGAVLGGISAAVFGRPELLLADRFSSL